MLNQLYRTYQAFNFSNTASFLSSEKSENGGSFSSVTDREPFSDILVPFNTQNQSLGDTQTATFDVTYIGFPSEAQAAFEQGAEIWENLIASPATIDIIAFWDSIDGPGNSLGGSGTYYLRDFPDVPIPNTFYPTSLAHHLSGSDLLPSLPDALLIFDSEEPWYLGFDREVETGQIDLITVVIHELAHTLGFGSFIEYDLDTGKGSYEYPAIYDQFIINGDAERLIDLPNFSTELGEQLTSDNLFFQGSYTTYFNGGLPPKLFAPESWLPGSSISHLDELTYPAGNPNSLMTPFINSGEANHTPGEIELSILGDMGWDIPSLQVKNQISSDFNGDEIADILLSNLSSGENAYLIGPEYQNWGDLNFTTDWQATTVGNFNGDSFSDILFFDLNNSQTWYFDSVNRNLAMVNQTPEGNPTVALDLTGDGIDEILYHNQDNGQNIYHDFINGTWGVLNQTPDWTPKVVGNLDGDPTPEIVFSHASGQNLLYNYYESIKWEILNNTPEWQPQGALDFNNDGIEEILYHNSISGDNLYLETLTNQWSVLNQTPGWIPLA